MKTKIRGELPKQQNLKKWSQIMVYIEIPNFPENNRINKDLVKKEIENLGISDEAKHDAYAAIYKIKPRGVEFEEKDAEDAGKLESALQKLGIPFRRSEERGY